jgi:hypothetical protein
MKWDQSCVIDWRMFIYLFIYGLINDVSPWTFVLHFRQLVSSLQTRWSVFHLRPVHVGFVVHEVALEQIFLRVMRFCTVIIQ